MNSFFYLFRTKIKGSIRVQFSSLGTGMAVIFMVLIYGVLIGTIFTSSVPYQSETMYLQTAMAILAGVGVTAFFSLLSLMSKRKALLYDTDAFYFFFRSLYKDTDKSLYFSTDFKRCVGIWIDWLLFYRLAFYGAIFFNSIFSFMSAGIFPNQRCVFANDRLYLYVDFGKTKS